jgi:hypothetical protein
MPRFIYFYTEWHYAECRYAKCRGAHSAAILNVTGLLNEISRCEENVFCAEPMFIPRPGSSRYQRHITFFICH